ncbi:MAG: hypothetical protein N2Z65_01260 [Clostridiales bacterium]|nr:hypothetical protein [Clostridiales bacterium]
MEHLDIINRIIEAEKEAKKIAEEAASAKNHLNEMITNDKNKIREDYLNRANRRIEIVRENERVACDESIAQIDTHLKQKLEIVEETFSQSRERWVDDLFRTIVGK